jgi:hypothetical protein
VQTVKTQLALPLAIASKQERKTRMNQFETQVQAASLIVGSLYRKSYQSNGRDSNKTLSLLEAYIALRQALPKVKDGSGRHIGYQTAYPTTQPSIH